MQLKDIAFESLKRRRGRFAFVVATLMLGIGTVVALVSLAGMMQREVGDQLDRFGANIVVTPKSTMIDLGYGGMALGDLAVDTQELTVNDAATVRTIPNRRNVSAVAPTLIGTTEVDGKRVLAVGVKFDEERRVKSWWDIQGQAATRPDEAMLGSEAASVLGKKVGDDVIVGDRPLRIVGVIGPTGSLDDRAIYADLPLVQKLLGRPGAVSYIDVSALCRACPIDDIVKQIATALPHARVAPIRQAVAAREQAVLQFTKFAYAVSAVVLLVGALVVMTSMVASVVERTQEIGILRAVGFRQSHVARLILLEALAVSVAGSALGWIAGVGAARLLGRTLAGVSSPIPLDGRLALVAMTAGVLLGVLSGLYPAAKAARLDPNQALRHL